MARDSQRSRVWAAETAARGPVIDREELTVFANRIVRSAWFRKQTSDRTGRVHARRALITGWGRCSPEWAANGTVTFPLSGDHRTRLDVLHAVAHATTETELREGAPFHGPDFCKAMLAATQRWESIEAKRDLQAAFKAARVKHRTWSAEARAAASARGKARYATEDLIRLRDELSS